MQDIVKHTAGLGFITSVKVTGTDESTTLDAMDADRTVILQATMHNAVEDFNGEFGLESGFFMGVTGLPNYQTDDATVDVVTFERNGTTVPDAYCLKTKKAIQTVQYRFMSKEIIEQTLQTVKFKGVEWDVTFAPTKAKVSEPKQLQEPWWN